MSSKRPRLSDLHAAFEEATTQQQEITIESAIATALAETSTAPSLTGRFDYEVLPDSERDLVRTHEIAMVKNFSVAIIAAGRELLAIHAIIKRAAPGSWTTYLQTALPFSESSARNYMRAARLADDPKTATVAEMGTMAPTALYATARASQDVQRDVVELLAEGITITAAQIDALDREHHVAHSPGILDEVSEAVTGIDDSDKMENNEAIGSEKDGFVATEAFNRDDEITDDIDEDEDKKGKEMSATDEHGRIEEAHFTEITVSNAAERLVSWLRHYVTDKEIAELVALFKAASARKILALLQLDDHASPEES